MSESRDSRPRPRTCAHSLSPWSPGTAPPASAEVVVQAPAGDRTRPWSPHNGRAGHDCRSSGVGMSRVYKAEQP
ncbi:hypothetical protein FHR80_003029 [Cellulomonas cellasea]|uniref:Uncharacterized protein n=1 Tax=Cellulomonas cellasea TaxID=43670 RepID=A0A7W4YD17_9CELL|nr:hypothetical protein [Cellulomonas cellasea]